MYINTSQYPPSANVDSSSSVPSIVAVKRKSTSSSSNSNTLYNKSSHTKLCDVVEEAKNEIMSV